MLTKKQVLKVIKLYSEAWIKKDSEKILEVFTPDAVYQEWAFEKPHVGHKEIKKYWKSKVVDEQRDIEFKLLDLFIDTARNTAIAEWEARFFINNAPKKNHMKEVAILEFKGNKIKRLREYWANKED